MNSGASDPFGHDGHITSLLETASIKEFVFDYLVGGSDNTRKENASQEVENNHDESPSDHYKHQESPNYTEVIIYSALSSFLGKKDHTGENSRANPVKEIENKPAQFELDNSQSGSITACHSNKVFHNREDKP